MIFCKCFQKSICKISRRRYHSTKLECVAMGKVAMFSERMMRAVNADLIRCLLDSKIIDGGKVDALKNLDGESANFELVRILQKIAGGKRIESSIGMLPLADDHSPISEDAMNLVGEKFAINNRILPISLGRNGLVVATADPFDVELMDCLADRFKSGPAVTYCLTSFGRIKNFFAPAIVHGREQASAESSSLKCKGVTDGAVAVVTVERKQVPAESSPPIRGNCENGGNGSAALDRFLENLLETAIRERASDVHLENIRDGMRVRVRIDGKLFPLQTINKILAQAIVAKVKISSNAKIDEMRLPQDRRVRMGIGGKDYDLRISILPTIHGENVAIRIFDQEGDDFNLNNIGLFERQLRLLEPMMKSENGLILLCGPTGCGKTTTLYTILKKISSKEKKVVTIEDPIEYRLDGINQVPVNDEIGLSFSSILRSVLRQSPNVIMVGEIRDNETAELAIQAALTGHLVFSTIHCNDSAAAITRLLDFKISAHLVKSCLRGAISQKLVRKPCQSCLSSRQLSKREKLLFPELGRAVETVPLLRGCENCSHRGYKGRLAVFDFLVSKTLVSAEMTASNGVIFDDFLHAETFADGVVDLLKRQEIVFDDACHVLLL